LQNYGKKAKDYILMVDEPIEERNFWDKFKKKLYPKLFSWIRYSQK